MSPPITPYVQMTDPNDLALSDQDDSSESSAESARSPSTLGDVDPLVLRSYEDEKKQQAASDSRRRLQIIGWMMANTIANIGSVFINKSLFERSTFKYAQLSFAAYHFAITGIVLCTLSRSRFGYFEARRIKVLEMLPLSISLSMSVVISNLSLAYSSVFFYQIVRALLTPCVAAINRFFYKSTVPRAALMALMPMCVGIIMVTYSNPGNGGGESSLPTTPLGATFAFAGVIMTALHTVWMGVFQRRYQLDSTQLLLNQAPLGTVVLLYVIPWADMFPIWSELPTNTWGLLLLSGASTCVLDISHMHITAEVGPVSSTILENVKTILIVTLGGCVSGGSTIGASVPGVVLAIMGIVGFSIAMLKDRT